MTVKELIEKLKEFPEEMEVKIGSFWDDVNRIYEHGVRAFVIISCEDDID